MSLRIEPRKSRFHSNTPSGGTTATPGVLCVRGWARGTYGRSSVPRRIFATRVPFPLRPQDLIRVEFTHVSNLLVPRLSPLPYTKKFFLVNKILNNKINCLFIPYINHMCCTKLYTYTTPFGLNSIKCVRNEVYQ